MRPPSERTSQNTFESIEPDVPIDAPHGEITGLV